MKMVVKSILLWLKTWYADAEVYFRHTSVPPIRYKPT